MPVFRRKDSELGKCLTFNSLYGDPAGPFRLAKLTACRKVGGMYRRYRPKSSDMGMKVRWRKHICAICASKSARLHAFGADHPHHLGRSHEGDEGARCLALPVTGGETRRIDNNVLQFTRQRADQVGALYGENGNDLLHADLG